MRTVLVCDSDNDFREGLKCHLSGLGFSTVLLCATRETALELSIEHVPALVIIEAAAPIDGLTLAKRLRDQVDTLILLTVQTADQPLLKQAATTGIDAFLAKPSHPSEVMMALELALHTARRFAGLQEQLQAAQRTLLERKQIERAKGLLMAREQLTEEQAYHRMRSQAMASRVSMALLAEEMISSTTKKR